MASAAGQGISEDRRSTERGIEGESVMKNQVERRRTIA